MNGSRKRKIAEALLLCAFIIQNGPVTWAAPNPSSVGAAATDIVQENSKNVSESKDKARSGESTDSSVESTDSAKAMTRAASTHANEENNASDSQLQTVKNNANREQRIKNDVSGAYKHLTAARQAMNKHNWDEAFTEAELASTSPNKGWSTRALYIMGSVSFIRRNYDVALIYVNKGLDLVHGEYVPRRLYALTLKARCERKLGAYEDAIADSTACINMTSEPSKLYSLLSNRKRCYLALKMSAEAADDEALAHQYSEALQRSRALSKEPKMQANGSTDASGGDETPTDSPASEAGSLEFPAKANASKSDPERGQESVAAASKNSGTADGINVPKAVKVSQRQTSLPPTSEANTKKILLKRTVSKSALPATPVSPSHVKAKSVPAIVLPTGSTAMSVSNLDRKRETKAVDVMIENMDIFNEQEANTIQDYDKIIALCPKDADARFCRGTSLFSVGRWNPAVDDFKAYLMLSNWRDRGSMYAAILCALAYMEKHNAPAAKAILQECQTKVQRKTWPYPIVGYLLGSTTEKTVMDGALDKGAKTVANAYLGLAMILDNKPGGVEHLRWVCANGDQRLDEFMLSKFELSRLHKIQNAATHTAGKPNRQ